MVFNYQRWILQKHRSRLIFHRLNLSNPLFPAVIQVHGLLDALVGKAQQDFVALLYGGAQGGLLLLSEAAQHKVNLHPFGEVVADADAQPCKPVRAQCGDDVVDPVVGAAAPLRAQP